MQHVTSTFLASGAINLTLFILSLARVFRGSVFELISDINTVFTFQLIPQAARIEIGLVANPFSQIGATLNVFLFWLLRFFVFWVAISFVWYLIIGSRWAIEQANSNLVKD